MTVKLQGIIPAILTPFRNGEVDYDTLEKYVSWLLEHGVHGLFLCGTNGEGVLLSTVERKKIAEIVVSSAAGKVPVLVQTGAASTAETIELTCHAQRIGADGAGVVAPFYFPYDDKSLEEHFVSVARSVPHFPIYLYNIPGNAKNDIKPKVLVAAAERSDNIVGIKDSSKDMARLQDYLSVREEQFSVIVGSDALTYPAISMGAAGVVSAVANVFPEYMVALYEAIVSNDRTEACRLQYMVNKLRDALKIGPYIAPYKKALEFRGFPIGTVRRPLREMTKEEENKMQQALDELGVI